MEARGIVGDVYTYNALLEAALAALRAAAGGSQMVPFHYLYYSLVSKSKCLFIAIIFSTPKTADLVWAATGGPQAARHRPRLSNRVEPGPGPAEGPVHPVRWPGLV